MGGRTIPAVFALLALAAVLGLTLWPAAGTAGATFPVTKVADTNDGACDADCSLREAIISANVNPGADTISLPAGNYTLAIAGLLEKSYGRDGGGGVRRATGKPLP